MAAVSQKGQINLLKNNGKEYFIAFCACVCANIAVMVLFYYLHATQGMFASLDVPRFTSIAVVMTPLIAGIICYARHKKKDDTTSAVIAVSLMSFAAAFVGCVAGAAIAASAFGKLT